MTEAKRKKLMYGILVVAVVWGAWNLSRPRPVRPLPHTPPVVDVAVQAESTTSQATIDVTAKRAEAWGRDPFTGSLASGKRVETSTRTEASRATAAPAKGWSLTGIIDNGTMPFAFINGKMVKVGDLVDQARVVRIEKQKVTLSVNGNQFSLQVSKG